MHIGFVDLASRAQIEGWAADPAAPNDALQLVILVNGSERGRATADRLRRDLLSVGRYGDGRHGFLFRFEPPLQSGAEHEVVVRCAGSETVLTRGAFRIARDGEFIIVNSAFAAPADQASAKHNARPRYILHVGLPKTGTKYLQHNFYRLRQQLHARGVYYPIEWWPAHPIFAHHALAEDLRTVPNPLIERMFSQLNDCGSDIVLLSSEGFNPVPQRGLEYLRDLTRGAKIEIVFYTRRWSDWIPSQWQQAVKQGAVETFPEWSGRLLANADRHPGINQALFLDKFARIFGKESVRLASYSNLMDHNVDIFQNFCGSILNRSGLGAGGGGNLVHESMGIFVTELVRCLNARHAMHGRPAGYHVFQGWERIAGNDRIAADATLAFAAMERHTAELPIDDNASILQAAYARLSEYRDCLLNPEFGDDVFIKASRNCRYVQTDFLLEDGVARAVARISDAVNEQIGAEARDAAT